MFKKRRKPFRGKAAPALPKTIPQEQSVSSSSESEEEPAAHPYLSLVESFSYSREADDSESESENGEIRNKRRKQEVFRDLKDSIEVDEDGEEQSGQESDVLAEDSETEEENSYPDSLMIHEDGEADYKSKEEPAGSTDHHKSHLEKDITDEVKVLQQNKPKIFKSLEWPTLSSLRSTCRVAKDDNTTENHPYIPCHPLPNPDSKTLEKVHHIPKNVVSNWVTMRFPEKNGNNKTEVMEEIGDVKLFTPLQKELFTLFNVYCDVLYSDKGALEDSVEIQQAYCLHAMNHILKERAKVLLHSGRLRQMTPEQREQAEYRDQGITRPKVLILLPFKETALRVVKIMLELLKSGTKFEVSNKQRFKKEFSKLEEDEDPEDEVRFSKKPEDFQKLFAGNTEEHFRVGIALLKNSVRLYAPFYSSDIIVASPLGLRTIIGAEGESHYEHDFLSSIELLILDHSDVFVMQNWEHILHIFQHLNLTPKESHGADFSRVRNIFLDGHSKYYRQTIAISSVSLPQISSLFSKFCYNYKGGVSAGHMPEKGSICEIAKQLPLVFHKLQACTLVNAAEVRFRFFLDRIYRQYGSASMSHTLIYVAQYFDFVRLRNFMQKEWKAGSGPNFTHINDYSNVKQMGRAKRQFYGGKYPLMLYTERFHFYNRARIRGVRNLVFYELPTYPHFFSELCGMVRDLQGQISSSGSVLVMYSQHDARKLAATVGVTRCKELMTSTKTVHMFVTGATAET